MKTSLNHILAAGALALGMGHAIAVDSSAAADEKLAAARAKIAAKRWEGAIDELKRIDDRASADWNNLMGYSLRKSGTPDLDASEAYYNEALRIDPKHRGTLEYSGELYLIKGDVALAEQRLATLDKVCKLPCAEYTRLKRAIERYKGGGGQAGGKDY